MTSVAQLYRALLAEYGPQGWWPADDPFEIMMGAILVQRTAWHNASLAVRNLAVAGLLAVNRIADCKEYRLQQLIRPAGFYRVKAMRLRAVAQAVRQEGGIDALAQLPTDELRAFFLSLPGIGEETADAILLYAFQRPVVVLDGYFRRLAARLAGTPERESRSFDLELRTRAQAEMQGAAELNELHALIVAHGKQQCRKQPLCASCVLNHECASVLRSAD